MNDDLLKSLVEDELEAIEAAELWAANDEFFDGDDLPDEADSSLKSLAKEGMNNP
jgi:hypothetical protein